MSAKAGGEKVELALMRVGHGAGLPAPAYESEGAAGLDLRAALPEGETATIAPGARRLVPTGLAIALPEGFEAQVRARSGLALKHGIGVLNGPGTIDRDYRGEIGVLLANFGDAPFTVARGDRIAQLVVAPVARAVVVETAALDETARGEGGYGSTGVRAGTGVGASDGKGPQ